jgi:glycosyltransferase involved in cell wall biosynthesis
VKTSLIIATYNWKEALELTLLSVRNQSRMPVEIIVADDGSRDDTRELIERLAAETPVPVVHVWHEDEGFRLGAIRNKAIARATGDYIIQVDGDVVLHSEFVRDHETFSKTGTYCPGSRTLLREAFTKGVFERKQITFSPFEKGIKRPLNSLRMPWLTPLIYPDALRYDDIRGSNMAFWRADAIAVNGYNEDISGWGREDTEFVARLTFNGIKRRKLKFAAKQYHLYHPEASRDQLDDNDAILAATIDGRLTRCENGLDKYL